MEVTSRQWATPAVAVFDICRVILYSNTPRDFVAIDKEEKTVLNWQ
jgi:hypothetical protein